MTPATAGRWDGKWYFIMFDIPGKMERPRKALRARLHELGYRSYQNSVFVHKHDLRKYVEPFCEFYGIQKHIRFITAVHVD
jgi:CRISPR-associated endonuclease Cas2